MRGAAAYVRALCAMAYMRTAYFKRLILWRHQIIKATQKNPIFSSAWAESSRKLFQSLKG